jgi:hypothetical protein
MRRTQPVPRYESPIPTRATTTLPRLDDGGRRRFLKQLVAGAGAASLGGIPRLGHGQSLTVDFTKLDHHPLPVAPGPTDASAAAEAEHDAQLEAYERTMRLEALAEQLRDELEDAAEEARAAAEAEAEPAVEVDEVDGAPPFADSDTTLAQAGAPGVVITENRALWLQNGYLVLLRWRRDEGDNAVVAALEGSADDVSMFLADRVRSVDNLHNIDQLHRIEGELLAQLAPRVAPATIEVLHLDHDCTAVCATLDPSLLHPPEYQIDGEMPAVGWE